MESTTRRASCDLQALLRGHPDTEHMRAVGAPHTGVPQTDHARRRSHSQFLGPFSTGRSNRITFDLIVLVDDADAHLRRRPLDRTDRLDPDLRLGLTSFAAAARQAPCCSLQILAAAWRHSVGSARCEFHRRRPIPRSRSTTAELIATLRPARPMGRRTGGARTDRRRLENAASRDAFRSSSAEAAR